MHWAVAGLSSDPPGSRATWYADDDNGIRHWTTGTVTGLPISNPSLRTTRGRKIKVSAFIIFGAASSIHLLRGAQRYGFEYMLRYAGMDWYLLEILFCGTGVLMYAVRHHAA